MKHIQARNEYLAIKATLKNEKYMSEQKKFVNGLRAFKPHEKAPEYVKANLQVTSKEELIKWLNDQPGTFRLSLKEGKSGAWYLEVDSYVPKQEQPRSMNDTSDDLPF
jgi:hypothetical protein